MGKDEIRNRLMAARDSLPEEEKAGCDRRLREKLYASMQYQNCSNLFCYVSFRSEPDTYEIIKNAFEAPKRVYVPRVMGREMQFYQIEDLKGLIAGSFGIAEPGPENNRAFIADKKAAFDEQRKTNLMLLPGLAFDFFGNRIGYGGGYYDRYLQAHRHTGFYLIALAYDFQLLDSIEAQEHDAAADMIITPTRTIITKKNTAYKI